MNEMKRLYLSETDKKWGGVLGGVAEYFNVDPTPLRVLWVIITIFSGIIPGLVAYLLAWLLIPKRGEATSTTTTATEKDPERII